MCNFALNKLVSIYKLLTKMCLLQKVWQILQIQFILFNFIFVKYFIFLFFLFLCLCNQWLFIKFMIPKYLIIKLFIFDVFLNEFWEIQCYPILVLVLYQTLVVMSKKSSYCLIKAQPYLFNPFVVQDLVSQGCIFHWCLIFQYLAHSIYQLFLKFWRKLDGIYTPILVVPRDQDEVLIFVGSELLQTRGLGDGVRQKGNTHLVLVFVLVEFEFKRAVCVEALLVLFGGAFGDLWEVVDVCEVQDYGLVYILRVDNVRELLEVTLMDTHDDGRKIIYHLKLILVLILWVSCDKWNNRERPLEGMHQT